MAKLDPAIRAHQEWIGYVQPTGLVVSAPALVRAGAILDIRDIAGQHRLRNCIEEHDLDSKEGPVPVLPDFRKFAEQVLEWNFSPQGYSGTMESPIPPELEVPLPEYGETLRPDFAVREREPQEGEPSWQLLVRELKTGDDFERVVCGKGGFEVSEHGRMERLLRRKGIPAGLLFNGQAIRLISAPRGESSGWLDFRVSDMVQTAGRSIAAAMRLLLKQMRLFNLPKSKRLAALLEDSRKFQNEVSERLAEQVLHALYELLRGFQAAHDASKGELLQAPLADYPIEVYRAMLTVILRFVFLLYAEERNMLPEDEVFLRNYSIAGLYERLREDAALFPDTMDQRYGAWAQLLVLFRMIFDGAQCGAMQLPERHGVLFDPDRFPFLEGRSWGASRQIHECIDSPLVPDGTVYRALEKLLILDGERISYRALDVEQIGSVYETMMGFRLETATGRSAAIKAAKKHGAPTTIDLEALLNKPPAERRKWILERTDRKLTDRVFKAVKSAITLEDLHAALEPVLDKDATPDLVPEGAMILQPSAERRRSGSHYTPRVLTEPIVGTALEPILKRLQSPDGRPPRPENILELKVCDPAMGSGAFLVEACRQLGDTLVEAWHAHDAVPDIPHDEDEVIFARRQIAQRCLYGVDRNPMAVDLAKVSLWLVTLAKEHSFTFLKHALRDGDSLVGLSREQIEAFHWEGNGGRFQAGFEEMQIRRHVSEISTLRQLIREADENIADKELRDLWDNAKAELKRVRLFGDLVIAAFFSEKKSKDREKNLSEFAGAVASGEVEKYRDCLQDRRESDPPLAPFHWEIEFPEVFDRENPGFDVMVGNPPFAGKNTMANANVKGYPDWLKQAHPESHGNSDLVAHFFRRAFELVRKHGAFGLIATNTIAQGDTRSTGLRWICTHGGEIFAVRKRLKWPGLAAVVVSVLHIMKGEYPGVRLIDERTVDTITAFLFHRGGHNDPARLAANAGKSFVGSYVLGMGFTFDDTDKKGIASSLTEMQRLIEKDPNNQEVIFPYIGGAEVNESPQHAHHRYVISFFDRSKEECRLRWPDLMAIVEERVKPSRALLTKNPIGRKRARYWWQYGSLAKELYSAIAGLERVLVISRIGQQAAFSFLPSGMVYSESLVVFPLTTYAAFCAIQSRPHEIWARFFGSSMKDDLRYTPSDCFETFPFPKNWDTLPALEAVGKEYSEFRAELLIRNNEGLTKTYNRFHDPEERDPDIEKLRLLHAAMDRAVLEAYGWSDIPTDCDFFLDYEIDEEEWGKKKKPWRYRWPDNIHDEVLARLLELNAERAREEARVGLSKPENSNKKRAWKPAPGTSSNGDLFS